MPRILIALFLATSGLFSQDSTDLVTPILPMQDPPALEKEFQWRSAFNESMRFTLVQHALRIGFQQKTRARLGGPFFYDYVASIKSIHGWGDQDPWFINYVGHPM